MKRSLAVIATVAIIWTLQVDYKSHAEIAPPRGDHAAEVGSDEGFVALNLEERQLVSGKRLLLIAYAAIFGLFLTYALILWSREKTLDKATLDLEKKIGIGTRGRSTSEKK